MMNEKVRRGGCLCGAVRVTATTSGNGVGVCHCSMCLKWTGGPMIAIECEENVRFEGEDNIGVYGSSDWAERGFCRNCGTHLFYRLRKEQHYALPVGLLDDREGMVLEQQIFVDEKPPFYAFANRTKNLTGAEVFALYGSPSE